MRSNSFAMFTLLFLFGLTMHGSAQTMVDSTLIFTKVVSEKTTVSIYRFRQETKRENGKIIIQDSDEKKVFVFNAPTSVEEIIKFHFGEDNRLRNFCSVVYRTGMGYYFMSINTNIHSKLWESQTIGVVPFLGVNQIYQIKEIKFAMNNPNIFKMVFIDPKLDEQTFAEISGKIENIDCHSCIFRD